ncbi:MAG: FAD/NAD(P)-binding oxidoreductase [Bacillota bacterium]
MATVVVLGGGTGGAAAARSLAARLPGNHRVILVEKEAELHFQPSFLQLMVGQRQLNETCRPVANLRAAGVDVIIDQALGINIEKRQVHLTGSTLHYDVLIVAAGADTSKPDPEGLGDAGFNLYTPDGAAGICRAIETFEHGEIVLLAAALPYKCPCALYEAALMLQSYFARRGLERKVRITVYSPEPKPVGTVGERFSRAVTVALAAKGVALRCGEHLKSVDPRRRRLRFASGTEAHFDLLIYIPRNHCPEAVRRSGLTDETGWVPADPYTLQTSIPEIYAIGDVNRVRLPSGEDLVKAGAVAHFQGLVVADNIAAWFRDRQPKRLFGGKLGSVIETGDSAFAVVGNVYRHHPNPLVLPASRGWRLVKRLAEWQWLREHG